MDPTSKTSKCSDPAWRRRPGMASRCERLFTDGELKAMTSSRCFTTHSDTQRHTLLVLLNTTRVTRAGSQQKPSHSLTGRYRTTTSLESA